MGRKKVVKEIIMNSDTEGNNETEKVVEHVEEPANETTIQESIKEPSKSETPKKQVFENGVETPAASTLEPEDAPEPPKKKPPRKRVKKAEKVPARESLKAQEARMRKKIEQEIEEKRLKEIEEEKRIEEKIRKILESEKKVQDRAVRDYLTKRSKQEKRQVSEDESMSDATTNVESPSPKVPSLYYQIFQ